MFKKIARISEVARWTAAVRELVQYWWRVDRIGVSPLEGLLLRMRPGTVVYLSDVAFEIRERETIETNCETMVRYRCENAHQVGELWVTAEPVPHVIWSRDGQTRELFPHDLEIWGERAFRHVRSQQNR